MNFDNFIFFATGVCVGVSASMLLLEDTKNKNETAIFALELRADRIESDIRTLFRRISYKSVDKKEFERAFAELEKGAEKE